MDDFKIDPIDSEVVKYVDYFRNRVTELRIKKNVSENKMSMELGNSRSYINAITAGKALPRMEQFFQMCVYFDLDPRDFFDELNKEPRLIKETTELAKQLNEEELIGIQQIIRLLIKSKSHS